ncbi:MAG TPA: hypothetical protein VJB57_20225 [Dehalococcoidia bacterium]|nr:hypothetical protein [Dehalococcoidia bacterium]
MSSRRKAKQQSEEARASEPLVLWWMPVVSLAAPILFAAWTAASADSEAMGSALMALLWPGVALYLGSLAVLWGGWKIELE